MRKFALAALVSAFATAASAASYSVHIDQSARINLPGPAKDVLVGNPAVADVTLLTPTSMAILGKGYGVTNLVVIGADGRTLLDRQIVVSSPDENVVTFYRGPAASTYACSPRCERASGGGDAAAGASGGASAPASTSN